MNQAPIKKEGQPSVKVESGTNNSKPAAEAGWQEIPLKSCKASEVKDIRHHVMKFQAKQNVDIVKNFNKPIRLHRKDPRNIQFQLTRKEIDERKKEQEEARKEKERRKAQGLDIEDADMNQGDGENGTGNEATAGEMDMSQVAPDGGARKSRKNMFKRKTRQINLMHEDKRKLRYEEYYPWVIEDYDGSNVFVGNYEAGASDTTHVLFVFDKDGFKMVPAEKVYRFTPRNKYATLTLEEAEAKMEKKSSVPRWLMKHMEEGNTSGSDQRYRNLPASSGALSGNVMVPGQGPSGRKLKTVMGGASGNNDRDSDHDDLDFDEEFADDEEAPIMDGDEEENKLSEKKVKKEMLKATHFDGQPDVDDDDLDDLFDTKESRKVDKEGEKLRKVLNKTEGGVYESDDDDRLNPYLSKSDLESNDDSDDNDMATQVKSEPQDNPSIPSMSEMKPRSIFANNMGNGFILIKATTPFLKNFPAGEWNPHIKSRISPTMDSPTKANFKPGDRSSVSPSPKPGVDLNSSGPDGVLVTTKEVLDIVRETPLTTKNLLQGLKNRVSAHKENKQRIIAIVKQNLKLVDGKLVLKDEVK